MALRLSDALRNHTNADGSFKSAFNGGELRLFTGTQPATANDAQTGTLLATITLASGARTAEVQAAGTVTLTGGASGSVDTLTVDGKEIMGSSTPFNTSLTQTAADVALKCNNNLKNLLHKVTSSGAVITITAKPGLGTLANGWVVASTTTTITKTDVNMSGGVDSVNGLLFNGSSAGTLIKHASQVWSGVGVAAGTAGWFRLTGAKADAGGTDSTASQIRLDGSVATSGGNLNMSNTTIAVSAVQTVNTFSLTEPAA